MRRRDFLAWTAAATAARAAGRASDAQAAAAAAQRAPAGKSSSRPNVLFLTVDDMNCDSIGVFGCKLKDTSPNLDRFARQGMRFQYAHVQVANCMPCRNVLHSGLYSHTNRVEGFYQVQADYPILPDVLKRHGYFVAIKGKVGHSTPSAYDWDLIEDRKKGAPRGYSRSPRSFRAFVTEAVAASRKAGKPFYLSVNITDPHKPFYGTPRSKSAGFDNYPPSRTFKEAEVPIPGFLPNHPAVRTELKHYYDSVRRADDCAGAVFQALKETGAEKDTVVMFLSDHGMPFPFAKTNLWHHSTRTPWMVRWPGRIKPGSVDTEHMISGVDFMPTVLDIAGARHPDGLQGRSFLPVLLGRKQPGRDHVIKEYNQNAGGSRHPMRAVETKRFLYIFNPWADGKRKFRGAAQGTQTYRTMVELAKTDAQVAARLHLFDYRALEEFYDLRTDRDCLHNLIGQAKYRAEIDRHRKILQDWMVRTKDHALVAMRNRTEVEALKKYMDEQDAYAAKLRAERRKRRGRGRRERGARILVPKWPDSAPRGGQVTVALRHKVPANLGEQLVHVTIKSGDGKRIERKVVRASGTGTLEVTFAVPDRAELKQVVFAAFVGADYPHCLQHIVSKPVPVK